jgi:TadE-like protein
MMRRMVHKFANETGAEIAEAAVVLPIVFMFLLGIVWFGRAFNIYSTITHAAQQGAIAAARSSCVTCGNNIATDTTVDDVIVAVLQSSNLNPSQIQASPKPSLAACVSPPAPPGGGCPSTATANIWICRNVQLNSSSVPTLPQQCGSVVTFQYPFTASLPFTSLNQRTIVLTAQAQSRMEN